MVTPIGYADIAVELKHTLDPDPWFVTFGVAVEDQGVDGNTGMLNDIKEKFEDAYGGALSTAVTVVAVRGAIGNDGSDIIESSTSVPQAGSNASDMLPQNCAALVTKQTALGGRRGRGRYFLPGMLPETQVGPTGILAAPIITSIQTKSDDFLSELELASGLFSSITPMVLLHRPGSSSLPATPTPVTGLVADSTLSTQRRRLR